MRVLVTGATGFIGSHLCPALRAKGYEVLATARHNAEEVIGVGDMAVFEGWQELLKDIDIVIHLAGRVHQVKERAENPDAAFHKSNVIATEKLLRGCEKAGVKQFVFLSTIAVCGYSSDSQPFTADLLAPYNPYSRSKAEAEKLVQHSGLPYSIVRIPLVYGKGVRANMRSLIDIVNKGIPLPFAMVKNRRSVLYVGNLTDALCHIIGDQAAYGQTLMIADSEPLSSPELIRLIASVQGKKAQLLPVPPALMKLACTLTGKKMMYHKLCGNLEMATTSTNALIDWHPPYSTEEGMHLTLQ